MAYGMDSMRPALEEAVYCGNTKLFASLCIVTFLYEVSGYQ